MEVGLKNTKTVKVEYNMTAASLGSGLLPVFATPYLVAMIEATCKDSVQPYLPEGSGTVGTKVEVEHLAPSVVGTELTFKSELIEIDRRKLVFVAEAYNKTGLVGRGRHERFIIDNEKFMKKAEERG